MEEASQEGRQTAQSPSLVEASSRAAAFHHLIEFQKLTTAKLSPYTVPTHHPSFFD
jgi:hypothetical protein